MLDQGALAVRIEAPGGARTTATDRVDTVSIRTARTALMAEAQAEAETCVAD
jgi:hypothetical protein